MGRDFNAAIHNLFPAETLLAMGYDLKDLEDAGMLQKILFDSLAYQTRSRHQLSSLLTSLSDFGSGSKENVLTWNAGDEEESTTTLEAASTYQVTTGTGAATIALAMQTLVVDNHIMLHDFDGTDFWEVVLQISTIGTIGSGTYTVSTVSSRTSHATNTHTFLLASTQVTVVASTSPLDGRAGSPVTITPKLLDNYMERMRESGIIGSHTNSGMMNFDGSIGAQMKQKMKTFLERLNYTLAIRSSVTNPTTVAGNVGRMKGFQDFFNPADRTDEATFAGVDSGMTGVNAVFGAGTEIDRYELMDWLSNVAAYGSDSNSKMLAVTPAMALAMEQSLLKGVNVNVSEFRIPGSNKIWTGTTYELTTGTLHVVPDYSLQNTEMYVEDNSIHGTGSEANTKYWGVCFDPEFTKLVYKDAPADPVAPGIQRPAVRDVDSYGADSRVQQEANASLSLFVKRPETGGFVAWNH